LDVEFWKRVTKGFPRGISKKFGKDLNPKGIEVNFKGKPQREKNQALKLTRRFLRKGGIT